MRRFLAAAAAVVSLAIAVPSTAGATAKVPLSPNGLHGVLLSKATLTVPTSAGYSAVSLTFHNHSAGRILIRGVASPIARQGMIHFDVNMCQDGSVMIMIPDISVGRHRHVKLSTRGMGAMLRGIHGHLVRGDHELVAVTWSTSSGQHYVTWVQAKVVRRPHHLHFGNSGTVASEPMGSMRM